MATLEIVEHSKIDGVNVFFNTVIHKEMHFHPEWEILFILEGSLQVYCNQQQQEASVGQILCFSPNQAHELSKQKEQCTFLCLQMKPECFQLHENAFIANIFVQKVLDKEQYRWLEHMLFSLAEAYFHHRKASAVYCFGVCNFILYLLLSNVADDALPTNNVQIIAKRNARLLRFIEYVNNNYMHRVSLTQFAKSENRSLSCISHFVKEMLNQSFQEYVASVRFQHACKMIAMQNKKMIDICIESGFSDYKYFSRVFKQKTGLSPEAYRRLFMQAGLTADFKNAANLAPYEQRYSIESSIQLLERFQRQFCPVFLNESYKMLYPWL